MTKKETDEQEENGRKESLSLCVCVCVCVRVCVCAPAFICVLQYVCVRARVPLRASISMCLLVCLRAQKLRRKERKRKGPGGKQKGRTERVRWPNELGRKEGRREERERTDHLTASFASVRVAVLLPVAGLFPPCLHPSCCTYACVCVSTLDLVSMNLARQTEREGARDPGRDALDAYGRHHFNSILSFVCCLSLPVVLAVVSFPSVHLSIHGWTDPVLFGSEWIHR
mmetsp:Transcript_15629/g.31708  ORF Transcript_15629/g.31708 Transcript_15629/m.31708 type:complete len:227 (+) Transcript_15629:244-924(+)